MCWKYEDECHGRLGCFDYFFFEHVGMEVQGTFDELLYWFGLEIDNPIKFEDEFMGLMSKWYEEGKIKAIPKEVIKNNDVETFLYTKLKSRCKNRCSKIK